MAKKRVLNRRGAASKSHVPEALAQTSRGLLLPAFGLLAWYLSSLSAGASSPLFASPTDVLHDATGLIASGELWRALCSSLARMTGGFLLGALLGLGTGLALGISFLGRCLFGPTLDTVRNVSLFAWVPLIMAWFGLGETSKVVFIAIAVFFPVFLNTLEGMATVSRELVEVGRIYRFSRWQMISRIAFPSAIPSILTGVHLALIYAWLATLGAEYMLTSSSGIGSLLSDAREDLNMQRVLVGMTCAGLIGFLLNTLLTRLERRLLKWRRALGDVYSI
ncbi:ABC transporter permease subunit [Pseudomonas sp. D5002]|uniref:ABC transporter permease n=1 Tax=Pseudomonas sp. D5002 TaxID=2738818 RepID=UPI0015A164F7|nr:ABC transporter permease subunit [Pseudomonas sp. D5002]NWB09103.1 ABC transporter permease subunit [Pseudomonas sp. D5002]